MWFLYLRKISIFILVHYIFAHLVLYTECFIPNKPPIRPSYLRCYLVVFYIIAAHVYSIQSEMR